MKTTTTSSTTYIAMPSFASECRHCGGREEVFLEVNCSKKTIGFQRISSCIHAQIEEPTESLSAEAAIGFLKYEQEFLEGRKANGDAKLLDRISEALYKIARW